MSTSRIAGKPKEEEEAAEEEEKKKIGNKVRVTRAAMLLLGSTARTKRSEPHVGLTQPIFSIQQQTNNICMHGCMGCPFQVPHDIAFCSVKLNSGMQ